MRRQPVRRDLYPIGVQDQMAELTARPVYTLKPRESIQKYLGKMPAGGALLIPEGTWTFYEDLVVPANVRLQGVSWRSVLDLKNGAVVRMSGERAQMLDVQVLSGDDAPRTTDGGITVTAANVKVLRVWAKGCYNGIAVLAGGRAVSVVGCTVSDRIAGGLGISSAETHGFLANNYIVHYAGSGTEISVTGTKNVAIGNMFPGGFNGIGVGNIDIGNYN